MDDNAIYLLYSPRGLGWFTKSSTYSTDLKEAKTFTRDDALALVKLHKQQGSHNMLPVRMGDLV